MDFKKDYYQILEVSQTASKEDIRAAYRRLAKLYHPDKNQGSAAAEEKFKLINEANEVLGNDILKREYDDYRAEEERWKKAQAEKEANDKEIKESNKKHYTKTTTIVTETRIYIRGDITIKYWADCKEPVAASHNVVLDYKINPTEAAVMISEQHIFPVEGIPQDYLRAYKESDIFTVPIPQPIRCEIISESGKEHFELTLNDIRIKNIKLEGVTKHEHRSYGTLKGQCYAYSPKFTYRDETEIVEECFGETGNVERKEESGFNFVRKEYYYPDCSKYWGGWVHEVTPRSSESNKETSAFIEENSGDPGCGWVVGVFALLLCLFIIPQFFIFCLVLTGMGLLLRHRGTIFSFDARIFNFLGFALLLILLVRAVLSISNPGTSYIKKNQKDGSVKATRTVRRSAISEDSASSLPDTLITHFLKWQDYTGKSYDGNISISVAALRNANARHEQMRNTLYQDIIDIYKTMLDYDSSRLDYLYKTFDSIKVANNLNEVAFSQLLVSAIQSVPYFLVLDRGCDENYSDDFTRNYLANCNADCCIGNQLFGVRSPVEFLSDLKGDCDTRALLLYQLLKHYNYEVALLTSNHYKHAMIAVSFTEPVNQKGLSINIGDKKYYMWETTSPHLNYGEVAPNFNNLRYWDISLINKKIQYEINSEHL